MSSCRSCSLLMVGGLCLSHQVGPKLIASTLGDLIAVASKLLWPRPELSQGLYIQSNWLCLALVQEDLCVLQLSNAVLETLVCIPTLKFSKTRPDYYSNVKLLGNSKCCSHGFRY